MKEIYEKALSLYDHRTNGEDVKEALKLFEQVKEYGDAEKYITRCHTLLEHAVGCTLTMGQWEGEPITWRVIAERGKQRLLLAERVVLKHPYMNKQVDATWGTCDLRRWLNNDFLKTAFDAEERAGILFSKLENPMSPKYTTEGGANTTDRVFILRNEELDQYNVTDREMGCWWWTRTPGMSLISVTAVYNDGSYYEYGIHNHYADGGVRPAMWQLLKV